MAGEAGTRQGQGAVTAADDVLVALTTLSEPAQAQRLVQQLVEQRLVACGTILPGATSVYRWQGQVTGEPEVVVMLKTSRARWDALKAAVTALHPYDVPELLAVPVKAGLERYLDWVAAETS